MAWDKTRFRMERSVRYELAGMPDSEIATRIGITPAGLAVMKARTDYQDLMDAIKGNLLQALDDEMSQDINGLKAQLQCYVPQALLNLANAALQNKDTKLQFEASKEILKMDGRLTA